MKTGFSLLLFSALNALQQSAHVPPLAGEKRNRTDTDRDRQTKASAPQGVEEEDKQASDEKKLRPASTLTRRVRWAPFLRLEHYALNFLLPSEVVRKIIVSFEARSSTASWTQLPALQEA